MKILRRAITMAARRTLSCPVPGNTPDMSPEGGEAAPLVLAMDTSGLEQNGDKKKKMPAVAGD